MKNYHFLTYFMFGDNKRRMPTLVSFILLLLQITIFVFFLVNFFLINFMPCFTLSDSERTNPKSAVTSFTKNTKIVKTKSTLCQICVVTMNVMFLLLNFCFRIYYFIIIFLVYYFIKKIKICKLPFAGMLRNTYVLRKGLFSCYLNVMLKSHILKCE